MIEIHHLGIVSRDLDSALRYFQIDKSQIDEIVDPDNIILAGTFYGFLNGGYEETEELIPGKGYWVRSSSTGNIIITN